MLPASLVPRSAAVHTLQHPVLLALLMFPLLQHAALLHLVVLSVALHLALPWSYSMCLWVPTFKML